MYTLQAVEATCRELNVAVEEKDTELQEQAVELQRALDVSKHSSAHLNMHIYIRIRIQYTLAICAKAVVSTVHIRVSSLISSTHLYHGVA
jgi:maltooligosyltrehalose synthase